MLDIVYMEMCKSIDGPIHMEWEGQTGTYTITDLFSERHYPQCTCGAFKYGKRVVNFGGILYPVQCKHILAAQESVCGWHALYGESQIKEGACPRCGGPTVTIRVGV